MADPTRVLSSSSHQTRGTRPRSCSTFKEAPYWGTTYLLAPDRHSVEKLFQSSEYEFADLNREGVYELIAWSRRPFDLRCNFGVFNARFYPEVFVRAGTSYRKTWPPIDWAPPDGQIESGFRNERKDAVPWGTNFQISAALADLIGNGAADLVVLQDRLLAKPAQSLAIYRLDNSCLRLVARTSFTPEQIAFVLWGIREAAHRKEILIQSASPEKCRARGDPEEAGAGTLAYTLKGDRLRLRTRGL